MSLEIGYSRVYRDGNVLYCDLVIFCYTLRVIVRALGLPVGDAMRVVNAAPVTESGERARSTAAGRRVPV
jgi:hypothetical protein